MMNISLASFASWEYMDRIEDFRIDSRHGSEKRVFHPREMVAGVWTLVRHRIVQLRDLRLTKVLQG